MPQMDSYVKMLLHFDENLQDAVVPSRSITNGGGVSVSSAPEALFGTAQAGYFNGTSTAVLSFLKETDIDFSNQDFTLSWWEYRISNSGDYGGAAFDCPSADDFGLFVAVQRTSNVLQAYGSSAANSWNLFTNYQVGTLLLNQWVYREFSRQGGTFYAFENGQLVGTQTGKTGALAFGSNMYIGRRKSANYPALNGYLREWALSVGICRHTQDFEVPDGPYTQSLDTPLLSAPLAAPENSSVLVSWTSVEDAQSYELQANGANVYSGASTSYQGQIQSSSVTWRVRAVNEETQSDWSSEKTTVVLPNLQNVILGGE